MLETIFHFDRATRLRDNDSMYKEFMKNWNNAVPNIDGVLDQMQEKSIIAIGVVPYTRAIPSLFLKNYYIYCVRDVTDIDVLQGIAKIYCLEQKNPKVAQKVHSTNYLIRHSVFKQYLQSRRYPYRLMFNLTNAGLVKELEKENIEYLGNSTDSFEDVNYKAGFRDLVTEMGLPHLPYKRFLRDEYLGMSLQNLNALWEGRTVVVQRADMNAAGEEGTFFIHGEQEWKHAHDVLSADDRFTEVQISPFVKGQSVSMLGCVTHEGVLTTTLQLELVDVPELLHERHPNGAFLGHDWTLRPWGDQVERTAQTIVESIGAHIAKNGFRGIFGIDFVYEAATDSIFPVECNPRYTGSLPVYSLMTFQHQGVPPIDFFHLLSQLKIEAPFNFDYVNERFKERYPISHVTISPHGIYEFKLPIQAGVYSYDNETRAMKFERPGAFPWDIQDASREFLMIDSIPRMGTPIQQDVQRIFQIIFPRTIAETSYTLKPDVGQFITQLIGALKKDQVKPVEG